MDHRARPVGLVRDAAAETISYHDVDDGDDGGGGDSGLVDAGTADDGGDGDGESYDVAAGDADEMAGSTHRLYPTDRLLRPRAVVRSHLGSNQSE